MKHILFLLCLSVGLNAATLTNTQHVIRHVKLTKDTAVEVIKDGKTVMSLRASNDVYAIADSVKLTDPIDAKAVDAEVVTIPFQRSPKQACWRLVHDGKQVLDLTYCSGWTETIQTLFCATEKAECEAEIERLKLIPKKEDE